MAIDEQPVLVSIPEASFAEHLKLHPDIEDQDELKQAAHYIQHHPEVLQEKATLHLGAMLTSAPLRCEEASSSTDTRAAEVNVEATEEPKEEPEKNKEISDLIASIRESEELDLRDRLDNATGDHDIQCSRPVFLEDSVGKVKVGIVYNGGIVRQGHKPHVKSGVDEAIMTLLEHTYWACWRAQRDMCFWTDADQTAQSART